MLRPRLRSAHITQLKLLHAPITSGVHLTKQYMCTAAPQPLLAQACHLLLPSSSAALQLSDAAASCIADIQGWVTGNAGQL